MNESYLKKPSKDWWWGLDQDIDHLAKNIGPYGCALLFFYRRHANNLGESWYGEESIATTLDMSKKTIQKYNKKLIEEGIISIAPGGNGAKDTNIVTIRGNYIPSSNINKIANESKKGANESELGGTTCPQRTTQEGQQRTEDPNELDDESRKRQAKTLDVIRVQLEEKGIIKKHSTPT